MKEKKTKFVPCDHLDRIGEIAIYYGFTPTKSPNITSADIDIAKDILENDSIADETSKHGRLPLHAEEKVALMRKYHDEDMQSLPQPILLYFKDPFKSPIKKSGYPRYAELEILGPSGSIAEATLIQTARTILAEEGYTNTTVQINSAGDRDSMAKFTRELTSYYRKNINSMPTECRQLFKDDPFELLSSNLESCKTLNEQAPKSMDFLSENSRRHLEELLEYFEVLNIPYTINNSLVANKKYFCETIFNIVKTEDEPNKKDQHILAVGMRYGGLSKRLGMKRDVQGVGISLLIKPQKAESRKPLAKVKRPIACFVQLGMESKLLSLGVIESLRQVKIPLKLSLAKDRLGAQVSSVEKFNAPYTIVMGKKEAVERNVIVRESETRAQEIVSLDDLPKHMKKLETAYWKSVK